MTESFIQLSREEETDYLLHKHPNAFLLLTLIARRARRYAGGADGLLPGQCHIGDYEKCGITRQQYRTALEVLKVRKHILICETCRNREKSTNGTTTHGTLVKIISTSVYDINLVPVNHPINHRPTTDQPPTNHEQRKNKNVKKEQQQQAIPVVVDFYNCLKENKILTDDEKTILMSYPESRVIAALSYAQSTKIIDTLISTLIWHCARDEIIPPKTKKIDIRKAVRNKFPNNSKHNGVSCYHDNQKIRFERGITGFDLDDKAPEYEDRLKEILQRFELTL